MASPAGCRSSEIKSLSELASTNPTPWETAIEIFNTKLTKDPKKQIDLKAIESQSLGPNNSLQVYIKDAEDAKNNCVDKIGVVRRNLENTFERLQEYTSIVNVAIQHDPHVTALVWGAIRLVLQACTPTRRWSNDSLMSCR